MSTRAVVLGAVMGAALAAAPALAQTPEALCSRLRTVAKADPKAPPPFTADFCQKMLTEQREGMGAEGWAKFAACVHGAKGPQDLGACNPGRFAQKKAPVALPPMPAGAPFEAQVVVLLQRVVGLAERHRPACAELGVALDGEQAAHADLVKQINAFRSLPDGVRAERMKGRQGQVVALVSALVPLAGMCDHPLLTLLVGSL